MGRTLGHSRSAATLIVNRTNNPMATRVQTIVARDEVATPDVAEDV